MHHGGIGLHWLSHHQLCQQGSLTTIAHTTDQNIYKKELKINIIGTNLTSSQAFPPSPDEQYNERDKPNQQSYCNPNGVRLVLQDLILHLFEHAALLGGSPLFPSLHISESNKKLTLGPVDVQAEVTDHDQLDDDHHCVDPPQEFPCCDSAGLAEAAAQSLVSV